MVRTFLLAIFVIGFAALSNIEAQEKKIERKDLPPAVEVTVQRESEGARVKGFSTEIENRVRLYEAEMEVNGRSKDISIDAKGNVVEVEEEVSMDSLPGDVKAGLLKAAGTGKIGKIESLAKKGTLVAYEAVVTRGTKHSEIQVGPNGRKLKHEED